MENIEELHQAEAHLRRAEAELEIAQNEEKSAHAAEQAALTEIRGAVEEIREAENHAHEIHFIVDGEPFETQKRELTPNQIIKEYGEKDPATHYLIQIKGNEKISYQGKGDEDIEMHDCMSFQIISTGPTPVSDSVGERAFIEGLTDLGYSPQTLAGKADHLFFSYPVEVGRCKGQTVRLGFVVPPDFPNIPPGGPHVSPHIQPVHPQNDVPHPSGGVHPSAEFQKGADGDWQYWSRPCPDWGQRKKTVASYMAHIWRLWETQ
jgi:hypothetical protein